MAVLGRIRGREGALINSGCLSRPVVSASMPESVSAALRVDQVPGRPVQPTKKTADIRIGGSYSRSADRMPQFARLWLIPREATEREPDPCLCPKRWHEV